MNLLVDLGVLFGVLCLATAAIVGLLHRATYGFVQRQRAELRAHFRFASLLSPLFVGALGVGAALLPSLLHAVGLSEDHCLGAAGGHEHAHLCLVHRPDSASSVLTVVVAALAVLFVIRGALVALRYRRDERIFNSVLRTSTIRPLPDGELCFDSAVPICATAGLLRPQVYVSSAALTALGPDCSVAALAHERAHVARHETRVRFLVCFVELFHLPKLGHAIAHAWHADSEFVCDEHAARSTGSATLVAQALVRYRRALVVANVDHLGSVACMCTAGEILEPRVTALLASNPSDSDRHREAQLAYVLGFSALFLSVGLQARHLHHVLESFVGAIASLLT